MDENIKNYNNNVICGSDSGLHTVIHHQCYQMVDLLIQHFRRSMCGLNPYALPYMPQHKEDMNETEESKKTNKRQKIPFDQGWKKQRNTKRCNNVKNNNITEKEREINANANQFQRLQALVGDMTEVTSVLTEVAKNDACAGNNNKKTIEKKVNSHHVDDIQMDVLNDLIDDKIEKKDDSLKKTSGEKIAKSMKKCKHESDDKEHEKEHESDNKKSCYEESACDYDSYDSEKERNECYLFQPNSDSDCSDSETSVGSSYEKWLNKKTNRMKGECLNEDSAIEYSNSDESIKSNLERWCNNRSRHETYSE